MTRSMMGKGEVRCANDPEWAELEALQARQRQEALKLHRAGKTEAEIAALMETA
jgi:hypothetical protein